MYVCVCVCTGMYMCMYVCMFVCMYVCMYVCVCMFCFLCVTFVHVCGQSVGNLGANDYQVVQRQNYDPNKVSVSVRGSGW